jgi:Papain family cysteine protease
MKLGWKKDKYDSRDFIHKIPAAAIPTSFSLAQFCPPVRDQGNLGACTGFGIGGILTGVAKQQKVFKEWFSPTWIYNGARFIEGTLTQDAGAEPGDCMDWLKKMGCLLESYWPYNPDILDKTSPPSKYNPLAAQHPLLTYVRVTGGSTGICSAIAARNLITIGTPWFDSWMNISATGLLPAVTAASSVAGGHMTFLCGYDQTKKLFSGQNSWDKVWGKSGTYLMPFNVFDSVFGKLGGYDAYYVTVNWVTPGPTPTPTSIPTKVIRLEESNDREKTWVQLYKGV